jgi:hypothetical protein
MFAGVSIRYFSFADEKYVPMDSFEIILSDAAPAGKPLRAEERRSGGEFWL